MTESRARQPAPREWAMEILHSDQDGCLVVGFTGSIDLFSVTQIRTTLLKDLSNEPYLREELRGDRLHIAVRDDNPRLLLLVVPDSEAVGGRGLWLVEHLARAWGVTPHPEGGKVVWCVLSL